MRREESNGSASCLYATMRGSAPALLRNALPKSDGKRRPLCQRMALPHRRCHVCPTQLKWPPGRRECGASFSIAWPYNANRRCAWPEPRFVCAPQNGDCHQFSPLELVGCTRFAYG
jgi:hypothetical protein